MIRANVSPGFFIMLVIVLPLTSNARGCCESFWQYNFVMKAKPNKGGRPPLAPGEAKGHRLQIRVTDAELGECQQAAKSAGLSLSEWVRDRVSRAANREARQN